MGCGTSSSTSNKPVNREEYHNRHPGLHNSTDGPTDKPVDTTPVGEDETEKEVLRVSSVELNIARNAAAHHTDKYDAVGDKNKPTLVIRRGQPFDVTLVLDRPYDKDHDDLRFLFEIGKRPKQQNGTEVQMRLSDDDKELSWGAKVKSQEDNTLTVTLISPPYCFIGRWNFSVSAVKKSTARGTGKVFEHTNSIVMLLNAWCKDDLVYMGDEGLLEEYVLAETGNIWKGSSRRRSRCPWNFGQFEKDILECALYLLEQGVPKVTVRGNPIHIARRLSAIVNSPDDSGVLVGNWSGNYEGGTSPVEWIGSVKILKEYFKTKNPVKYGQCWVFSGVLTTVCRALGLPARSVTNFASAHDTDASVTIDTYYDEDNKKLNNLTTDSVWNFHVWNDVWMKRPDLPPEGYDGWQAIDATPQETSDGVYCMGPCSLHSLKLGNVYLPYDGKFAFAEMNADRVSWLVKSYREMEIIARNQDSVGKYMSTNCPKKLLHQNGNEKRLDVTHEYKFPEGSEENKAAVKRAYGFGEGTPLDVYNFAGEKNVTSSLTLSDDAYVGDPGEFKVTLKNEGKETRTVHGQIHIRKQRYTGVSNDSSFMEKNFEVQVAPGESVDVVMNVSAEDLLKNVVDHFMYEVSFCGKVAETGRYLSETEDFRLRKPKLEISCKREGTYGKPMTVEVSFENNMPETLTACDLVVEFPGQGEPQIIKQPNVGAKTKFVGSFDITPRKLGVRELIVAFNSKQIMGVTGEKDITIT